MGEGEELRSASVTCATVKHGLTHVTEDLSDSISTYPRFALQYFSVLDLVLNPENPNLKTQ